MTTNPDIVRLRRALVFHVDIESNMRCTDDVRQRIE